jgi:hypothetical protein
MKVDSILSTRGGVPMHDETLWYTNLWIESLNLLQMNRSILYD